MSKEKRWWERTKGWKKIPYDVSYPEQGHFWTRDYGLLTVDIETVTNGFLLNIVSPDGDLEKVHRIEAGYPTLQAAKAGADECVDSILSDVQYNIRKGK